jgi:hypothetical protein
MVNQLDMRESKLISAVESELPEFARMCRDPKSSIVVMHQDAFAAGYQEEELRLLGMAIKFAGICGKEIQIIGKSRHTIDEPTIAQ